MKESLNLSTHRKRWTSDPAPWTVNPVDFVINRLKMTYQLSCMWKDLEKLDPKRESKISFLFRQI